VSRWRELRMLILSCLLHFAVIFGCLAAQLLFLGDVDKRVGVAIALVLVVAVGVLKGARYARRDHGWYVSGAAVASSVFTAVGLWLLWALTYPVGESPPLRHYVIDVLRDGFGALWVVAPVAATVAATLAGAEVGILIAGSRRTRDFGQNQQT